jgi:hypothetical protein
MQMKPYSPRGMARTDGVDKPPIFVVGVPRSGTTLLAAMLAAHSRLSCGPETRFFRFLARVDPDRLLESWPNNAVDFLYHTELVDSIPKHYGITREQIQSYLKSQPPSIPSILSSVTEQYMIKQGRRRWVEKSPEHSLYVNDIRSYFPTSPVVRIVRDPRDAALSMARTSWGPKGFLEALLFWDSYDEQSSAFFRNDGYSYTLYYEQLIQSPETELRRLCIFLDEEYEPQMLDTSKSAASVVTEKELHKRLVYESVDTTRVQVWKRVLSREQNRIAEALIGHRLIAYGYECTERLDRVAGVYPSLDKLLEYPEPLASIVAEGTRFWHASHDKRSHVLVYVGEPDRDRWLRYGKPERWWDTLQIAAQILRGKLAHRHLYWVGEPHAMVGLGFCSRVLVSSLRLAGRRQIT